MEKTENNIEKKEKKKNKKSRKKRRALKIFLAIIAGILIVCTAIYAYIIKTYNLTKIQVTGNIHYTNEEIVDIVTNGKSIDNTLFFYLENKFNPVENITFVDKFQIEIVGKHTVTITVYEKSMAGCVLYMDQYVYFDDEGTVLETSAEKLDDVPCIEGLTFSRIVIGEKLPVENTDLFQQILTMTQLIEKNDLTIDGISFNSSNEIILYKDNIKIELGSGENLEDKLMNLESILEKLDGKSGTLDLSDYTASSGNAIFKEN